MSVSLLGQGLIRERASRWWEHDFTVVNWDQRGSGKTFEKNGTSTRDVTLDRLARDAIEIEEYARKRLGKQKVILIGQSWGALLGATDGKRLGSPPSTRAGMIAASPSRSS